MSTDYNYDDQGQFFPYFIVTISALITLPLSYSLLQPVNAIEETAPRIKSDFKPADDDLIQGQKRKQWRRERRLKRILTVVAGYLIIAWMLYLISVTNATTPKIWDPYDILKISRSSSEKQIKKQFRDLSRTLHPDKAVPDESKNETAEAINDHWVEISKAFKALTDEDVRNNYIQYGHPDGKQSFSIGIALPKFIVTEGNGKYVLLVYGLLLGVLLPYVVGKWWYGTQRMTKEKVLLATASNLFQEYSEDITDGGVVNALSSGEEFKEVLKGNKVDAGLSKIEQSLIRTETEDVTFGPCKQDHEKLESYEGVRRKTAALLWAYLARIRLDGSTLDDEKYEVAPLALLLNESFTATTLAYGNTGPLLSAYRISQHLIQAIPPGGSPLLQLPHITPAIASAIEKSSTRTHLTIQQFMSLPEYKRRNLCTNQSSSTPCLTPAQYNAAISVARQLPVLHIEKAFFKVLGERFITPGSLVQFVLKARIIPPGSKDVPPVNLSELEDVDPDEDDLDAILGRRSASSRSKKVKILSNENTSQTSSTSSGDRLEKPLLPPLTHAPYFARDHSPRWHIFLADPKMGKVAVPPFTMSTFSKPAFKSEKEGGGATYNMQTFKMQFQAPPQPGQYAFVMHVLCDSYVGMDDCGNGGGEVILNVEGSDMAGVMESEGEISEPDEDSLAGQMSALKSGTMTTPTSSSSVSKKRSSSSSKTATIKRRRPTAKKTAGGAADSSSEEEEDEDDDDDESDTDGEMGEDESETDTETDTDGE